MRILSIRGGGMRGIVPAQIIQSLEEVTMTPAYMMFDMIVGTSTGGILALALGLGIPAKEIMSFYLEDGPAIFKRRWSHRFGLTGAKFDIALLTKKLEQRFHGYHLSECKTKVMAPATDLTTMGAYFFKSWKMPKLKASLVASCTAAAPTYFNPVEFNGSKMADGGLFANNPALFALVEGATQTANLADLIVLDIACPGVVAKAIESSGSAIHFAPRAVELFLDAGMNAVEHACEDMIGDRYIKIIPSLGTASPCLDDASERNMSALKEAGLSAARTWVPRLKQLFPKEKTQ